MKSICSAVAVTTILLLIQWVGTQINFAWESQAPTVTAAQIRALQADTSNRGRFLIVDVRDKNESDVSIIPGAITLANFEKTRQSHQGKAVITYCTVGYRSEIVARDLRNNGWNAQNYRGSILDWCENRLPVVTPNGQTTTRVHTYNSSFKVAAGYQPVY